VRAVLALAAALFLILAPLCAPLCAAKMCAPTSCASHCHEMNADGTSQTSLTAAKVCARSELAAIVLRSDEHFARTKRSRSAVSAFAVDTKSEARPSISASTDLPLASLLSPERLTPLLSGTVLRI
jgi:hypothetical protein